MSVAIENFVGDILEHTKVLAAPDERVTPGLLKRVLANNEKFDFLKEVWEKIEDEEVNPRKAKKEKAPKSTRITKKNSNTSLKRKRTEPSRSQVKKRKTSSVEQPKEKSEESRIAPTDPAPAVTTPVTQPVDLASKLRGLIKQKSTLDDFDNEDSESDSD